VYINEHVMVKQRGQASLFDDFSEMAVRLLYTG
jgi:hypothetical protein